MDDSKGLCPHCYRCDTTFAISDAYGTYWFLCDEHRVCWFADRAAPFPPFVAEGELGEDELEDLHDWYRECLVAGGFTVVEAFYWPTSGGA
jgi:hypothetical protein